jgi:Ca2+-binding EF-hand superfamily protein
MNKATAALAPALAGVLGALLLPGVCRAQGASGPGQLTRVLVDLQKNGKARTERGLAWLLEREAVAHLTFMATDPRGGTGGGGWYRPSRGRYGWEWLRRRLDKDGDGAVSFAEFAGPREWFEALDKNRDGRLTPEDFEWFGDSALARAGTRARALFPKIDRDGDGQVTAAEWKAWFDGLSGGKGYLRQDDLLSLFMDGNTARRGAAGRRTLKERLPVICSYISGDVGSLSEGPAVDEEAPYFTLATMDGKGRLDLARHRGTKPLVLIFGSFT